MTFKIAVIAFIFTYALCVIGEFNLTIVHVADFHSHWFEFDENKHDCSKAESRAGKCYGGFPRLLSFVRDLRKKEKNVLVLSSGEFFMGDSLNPLHGYKMARSLLPKLGLDAMCLANRDFDSGVFRLSVFLYSMKFPVVCANLVARNTSYLYSRVNKSAVIDVNGTKVGIVGYIHRHALKKSRNAVSFNFVPEIPALQEEVSRLENEGVDKIVALGHAGYFTDLEIAKKVKGVDIVIGGDSDIMLFDPGHEADELSKVGNIHGNYPRVHHQEPESADDASLTNRTLVLHIPRHGMYVGVLRATFDENGKIIHESGEPVLLDSSIPQDEATLDFIEYAKGVLEEVQHSRLPEDAEILGIVRGLLDGNPRNCRMHECSLGNFIADAILHEFTFHYRNKSEDRGTYERWGPIDAVVFNSGPILRSIEPGYIKIKDIVRSIYLGDYVKRAYMTGQQVIDMMEHSVKYYDQSGVTAPGMFLQIAGMKVEYDLTQPPGKRVRNLAIRCRDCGNDSIYYPIVSYKTYIIGMPHYMTIGRDGFYDFEEPHETKDQGQLEYVLIVEHLQRVYEVIPKLDGRIKFYQTNSTFTPPLLFGEPALEHNKVDGILFVSADEETSEDDKKEENNLNVIDKTIKIRDSEYETEHFPSNKEHDSSVQEPKMFKDENENAEKMSKSSDDDVEMDFLKHTTQSPETKKKSTISEINNKERSDSNSVMLDLKNLLRNSTSEILKSSFGNFSKRFLDLPQSSEFLKNISGNFTKRFVENLLDDNRNMTNYLEFKKNISSFIENLENYFKSNLPVSNLNEISNEIQEPKSENIVENAFEEFLKHILKEDISTDFFKQQTGVADTMNTTTSKATDLQ